MRIVIDMQGAQSSGSRNRGIGRYTLSLVKGIVRNRGQHEVIIVLNSLFSDTILSIRSEYFGLLPQENILIWYASGPVNQLNKDNDWGRKSAEKLREAFLASLKPDVVLISSLFEGLGDDAVTSIGEFTSVIPTAVILYDLIPLMNRSPYLDNPVVAQWYESKINYLRRANLLLSISESAGKEGVEYLGFPSSKVVNISTAADPQFYQKIIPASQKIELMARYGLVGEFVMYTGGIDYRKNIEGLIRAYALLPISLRKKIQLAIVCSVQDVEKTRLEVLAQEAGLKADELILTGFVPEDDLIALYNICKVFVFPSKHEGFGLPALEAMSCGRAVIGSNTSSLPEVIGLSDALFDPYSDKSIANKLEQVLTDKDFRCSLEKHGLTQSKSFTWDKSAIAALNALEDFVSNTLKASACDRRVLKQPRLAFISPLPPERSGISDYSAELLPELLRYYQIDVIVDQQEISDSWINDNCRIRSVAEFAENKESYDRVLYQFGNSNFHQHMLALLAEIPGVVVLHDFFLSGAIAPADVHGITPGRWAAELYHSHGYIAVHDRYNTQDIADVISKYPCSLSVLQNASGVIVHSDYSRSLVRNWYGSGDGERWKHIPLLRVPNLTTDKTKARERLGFCEADYIICSFGHLGSTKLNHRLLDAWLTSELSKNKNCYLVFVGENEGGQYGKNLLQRIADHKNGNRVKITGWAGTALFRDYLSAADGGVQLRTQSRGETSAAVLDCMNYGLATIVNANGSMSDLPSDKCVKLTDKFSDNKLVAALENLYFDSNERQRLSRGALQFIRTDHSPRRCARAYFNAIEEFYDDEGVSVQSLINNIAQITPSSRDINVWKDLAQSIDMSIASSIGPRQILLDISVLFQSETGPDDSKVWHNVIRELLENPIKNFRIEPVFTTSEPQNYLYARHFTLSLLGCPTDVLEDQPISFRAGDVLVCLGFEPDSVDEKQEFYSLLRQGGVNITHAHCNMPMNSIRKQLLKCMEA